MVLAQPPAADHHAHLQSRAVWELFHEQQPWVTPPAELERVLRAFENGWRAGDNKAAFAALFTDDGIFQWADDWVRGREPIRMALLGKAGGLRLRAQDFAAEGPLGHLAGAYGYYRDTSWVDQGRFVLSLRKSPEAGWRIAVAMLSNTTPPAPLTRDPIPAERLVALLDSAGVRHAAALSLAYQFGVAGRRVEGEYAKVRAENDWLAAQVARYPERLAGFCSFNPLKEYALAELARCGEDPRLRGVKLHFTSSNVDLRNPGDLEKLRAVFRAANARRLPLIVHLRTLAPGYGREAAALFLRELLPLAPNVPVQLAHLAGWGGYGEETDQALAVFAEAAAAGDPRAAKLYFDVSQVVEPGFSDSLRRHLVRRIRQLGTGRILFAVDRDESPRTAWERFATLPLEPAELRAIAGNLAPWLRAARTGQ